MCAGRARPLLLLVRMGCANRDISQTRCHTRELAQISVSQNSSLEDLPDALVDREMSYDNTNCDQRHVQNNAAGAPVGCCNGCVRWVVRLVIWSLEQRRTPTTATVAPPPCRRSIRIFCCFSPSSLHHSGRPYQPFNVRFLFFRIFSIRPVFKLAGAAQTISA